jgi:hypothetical protein
MLRIKEAGGQPMKSLKTTLTGAGLFLVACLMVVQFGNFESRQLRKKMAELERERNLLMDYAERLSASRRVAQVTVQRQQLDSAGRPVSTLLWQEIGADGVLGQPQRIEVVGTLVYFEAWVIKFTHELIAKNEAPRSASLALFRRVFGDHQAPESVPQFDRASRPPTQESEESETLHGRLWKRFWELVDDPRLAGQYGVRVAQCEAPAVPLKEGEIWEVTLDAAGGLNLRKIHHGDTLAILGQ